MKVPFDVNYYNFENIYSTNTWALQNYLLMNKNGITIVTASEQSCGRGRHRRRWESPHSNLYTTFCFFLDENKINLSNIPQVLALSSAKVLESLGLVAQIKWPNDLLVNKKKISGILCETKHLGNLRFVALGIGLNINMKKDEFFEINKEATSLFVETGKEYCVSSILTLLEEVFLGNLKIFYEKGIEYFYDDLKNRLYNPQEFVFTDAKESVRGKMMALNKDGSLSIKVGDEIRNYFFGEISTC